MMLVDWPDGMTRQPWFHQHEAYDFLGSLWHCEGQPGVALISDMGTGKSLVAVALWKAFGFKRVLIVSGTKAMVDEWPEIVEAETAGTLRAIALHGTVVEKAAQLNQYRDDPNPLAFVVNVESYYRDPLGLALLNFGFDAVFIDESQRIKAAGSKQSQFAHLLAKRVPRRLIMTGTPLHDKPTDAYGQYRFVDSTIFGTKYDRFKARYTIQRPIKDGRLIVVDYQNLDELAAKMHAVSFRVESDVLDLPPLMPPIARPVRLSDETAAAYDTLERQFVLDVDGFDVVTPNVLSRMTRLQQLTSGFLPVDDDEAHVFGTEKRDALVDLLTDLDPAKPVVVFAQYVYDLDRIRYATRFVERQYFEQSGRLGQWREWRKNTGPALLAVQYKAGGAGVDLSRTPYGIFYSHTFSLGDYMQAVKRIHRPGQTERTFLYHLVAKRAYGETIDAKIHRALAAKKNVGDYVVDEYRKELAQ